MLLVTMLSYLFFYTGRQNFGFAAKALQEELHLSATAIGSISAALLLSYGLGQVVNGNLGDRFGARFLVSGGALFSVALNWVVSMGSGYPSIVIPWAANGYAQSFGWAPSCRLIANWWSKKERGLAYGLLLLSAGFSSILTFALCLLVLQHLDWRYIFRLPVLLLAVGAVFFWTLVRNTPEEAGFETREQQEASMPMPSAKESSSERYRYVLRNRSFQIAAFSIGCESIARYGLLYWVPVRFLGPGWRQEPGSAWVTLALPIGMAAGALCTGYLSDTVFRGNRTLPIAWLLASAALVTGALIFVPLSNWWLGAALLALSGFLVYGPQAAYWALCPELVGKERAGTAVGLMDAAAYAFAAGGEVLIGVAVDRMESTAAVFYVVPAVCLLGALSILKVR